MKPFVILAAFLLTSQTFAPAHVQLKPEVQAALIKNKLTDALREKRYADVLSLIGELRGLNVPLPASMDYFEGLAAAETGDWLRAEKRVSTFLNSGSSDSPLFQPALQLYARIEPKVASAREEARAKAQRKIQSLIDDTFYKSARKAIAGYVADGTIADGTPYIQKIEAAEAAARRAVQAAEKAASKRKKDFPARMAASRGFFQAHLNYNYQDSLQWAINRPRGPATYRANLQSAVSWPGSEGECSVNLSLNASWHSVKTYDDGTPTSQKSVDYQGVGTWDAATAPGGVNYPSRDMIRKAIPPQFQRVTHVRPR